MNVLLYEWSYSCMCQCLLSYTKLMKIMVLYTSLFTLKSLFRFCILSEVVSFNTWKFYSFIYIRLKMKIQSRVGEHSQY